MTLKFNKILTAIFAAIFAVSVALGIYFLMPNSTAAYAEDNSEADTIANHDYSSDHSSVADVEWTDLNTSNPQGGTISQDGYYYLSADLDLSEIEAASNITISGTVYLCLNGNVLTGNGDGSVITVNSGANFTLCDCNTATTHNYYVDTSNNNIWIFDDGTDEWDTAYDEAASKGTVYGGVITGGSASSHGGGVSVSGTFTMEGGTIAGNYAKNGGGGVNLSSNATFEMYGGEISGNTAGSWGGGVEQYGTLYMYGGTITGNYAGVGGGININRTVYMYGGTISGNTANSVGPDVRITGTLNLYGGCIYGNIASVQNSTVSIMGGYLNGSISKEGSSTISITGGALSEEAYSSVYDSDNNINYITEGSEAIKTDDETWAYVVVPKEGTSVATTATCTEDGDTTYTYYIDSVKYTLTVNAAATGHNINYVGATNATCTKDGTIAHYECSVCGKYFEDAEGENEITDITDENNLKTGHSFTNYVSDNNATCTADGTKTATCDNGCDETDTITDEDNSATGHTSGEVVTEKEVAATCTTDGSYDEAVYCTICNAEISRESKTIAATGHTWGVWDTVTEATNTTDGEQQRTCSVCGEVETQTIPATGGLSGGAIAGIVIGCVVVAGIAVGLAIFRIRRRKNA